MRNLNSMNRAADNSADEDLNGPEDHFDAPAEQFPEESATVGEHEPDEFDVAAAGVTDETSTAEVSEVPAEEVEENAAKTADELAVEEYRKTTGASEEEAQAWLSAAKAAAPAHQPQQQQQPAQQQDPQGQRQTPPPGGGAMVASALLGAAGSVLGGVGGGLKGVARGAVGAANAALRASNVKPTAGLTPDLVKNRLFSKWHNDYESGAVAMERSVADIQKAAAAYNQMLKTSAPGRELEKIAKSRGTDIKTLLSQVVDGSFADADAKAAAESLRTDPHLQKAWSKVSDSWAKYRNGHELAEHNLTQLVQNNSDKIDLTTEAARLGEVKRKMDNIEQPLELPANPLTPETKADGKSWQKTVWEQIRDMSSTGFDFLKGLLSRAANFIASKFKGNGGAEANDNDGAAPAGPTR